MAGHVREYSVNLFGASLAVLFLFLVHRRFSNRPRMYIPLVAVSLLVILLAVTLYSEAVNNGTIRAVVQLCVFIALPLILHHISDHFPRLLFPAALTAFALFTIGFFMLHRLGPFIEGIMLQSSFPRAYLDPKALDTMHTFSFAAVPGLFIAGLLLLPLVRSQRSPYVDALGFGFWSTLIVYSLKLSAGGADRYLYHTAGLHTVLLATGILTAMTILFRALRASHTARIGAVLLLLTIVNPVNSVQAAFNMVPSQFDARRPNGLSGGAYYRSLADVMREHGAKEMTPLIEASGPPYLPSIVFQRRFSRVWSSRGGVPHEIGEGIYPVVWHHNVDHSAEAFANHKSGFLVTDEYRLLPAQPRFQLGGVSFERKAIVAHPHDPFAKIAIYGWVVEGPPLPGLGFLLSGE